MEKSTNIFEKPYWIPFKKWKQMTIGQKVLSSFIFTETNLNVEHYTWSQMSINEKILFKKNRKKWLRKNGAKNFKSINFWRKHYIYQDKIWNIYNKKSYSFQSSQTNNEFKKEKVNNFQIEKESKLYNELSKISEINIEIKSEKNDKGESFGWKNYIY